MNVSKCVFFYELLQPMKHEIKTNFSAILYFGIIPGAAFLGLAGNVLSLLTVLKQCKENDVYALQVVIMLSDCASCLAMFPYTFFVGHKVYNNFGPDWIVQNPFLVFWSCNVSIQLTQVLGHASLVLTLLTVIDRIYAIREPFAYKALNHKQRAKRMGVFSHIFGVILALPAYLMFFYEYCPELARYVYVMKQSALGGAANLLQTAIRLSLLLAIVTGAIAMTVFYRKAKVQFQVHGHSGQQPIEARTLATLVAIQVLTLLAGWALSACFAILSTFSIWFGDLINFEQLGYIR